MKLRFLLSFFICVIILKPIAGVAFVPQTPHLLHLIVQKIKQPVGIETVQIKTLLKCDSPDEKEELWLDERLFYKFPHQLRTETTTPDGVDFTIESEFRFLKVAGGQTVSRTKSPIDLYTDVLLYRDHESLLGQLALAGIDVTAVSFQRYEGTICYVVGQPKPEGEPYSALWVEKETFFPMRYVVEKDDWLVECVYSNWQKISKTWYPLEVSILLDNEVFATITVSDVRLKSGLSPALFDIAQTERIYPEKHELELTDPDAGDMEALKKRIEALKKIYE